MKTRNSQVNVVRLAIFMILPNKLDLSSPYDTYVYVYLRVCTYVHTNEDMHYV